MYQELDLTIGEWTPHALDRCYSTYSTDIRYPQSYCVRRVYMILATFLDTRCLLLPVRNAVRAALEVVEPSNRLGDYCVIYRSTLSSDTTRLCSWCVTCQSLVLWLAAGMETYLWDKVFHHSHYLWVTRIVIPILNLSCALCLQKAELYTYMIISIWYQSRISPFLPPQSILRG